MDGSNDHSPSGNKETSGPPGSHNDLLERMGALAEHVTAGLLKPHNLTPAQARVLGAVHRHGPDVALAEIASATAFPFGAVTPILDRLFLRRLIERTDAAGPGQRITCSVTPAGQGLILALGDARAALYRRLLDGLTEHDLAALGRLATRMEDEVAAGFDAPVAPEEIPEPQPAPVFRLIKGSRR